MCCIVLITAYYGYSLLLLFSPHKGTVCSRGTTNVKQPLAEIECIHITSDLVALYCILAK